jgi:hypothetical protein
VTFNQPTATTISGSIIWDVSSPVAFAQIRFNIDGGAVLWTETACPCYFNGDPAGRLNTATLTNGSHTLTAEAFSATGAKVAAGSKTVTVQNGPVTPPPPPPPPTGGNGCFANPGACGFPDPAAGNVGVPAGTTLTASGSLTITTAGTVIDGRNITGGVTVSANNVTIRNSRITVNGAGCGPTNSCGNSAISVTGPYTATISNVELTANSPTTVEHGVRNANGGTINLDHVYQHGNIDSLCYCGHATVRDTYSIIHLSIANNHLENLYTDGDTLTVTHNTLLNPEPQTGTIFANTANGNGGPCSNHLNISNNLLAGGGWMIYPCGNASSAGSSTVSITGNRFARCGGGAQVQGSGGTWVCPHGADTFGYYPNGGSFGLIAHSFSNTVWTGNVWDDTGAAIS